MRLRPHQLPADGRRALVTRYSLQRNSRHADRFDVQIFDTDDHPFLAEREGQAFLRDGERRVWRYDDLQSFARATVLAGWRTSGTISARRRWLPAAPEFQSVLPGPCSGQPAYVRDGCERESWRAGRLP